MRTIYILMLSLLLITACEDLEQYPDDIASSSSLTEFAGVLNAAYFYQLGATTPLAVMGEFRSDNALMDEAPYTDFDNFDNGLTSQENQFFRPFYEQLYKCILSANSVIENSSDATEVGEAKFLRALSYFDLVKVFGDVTVNLSAEPSISDPSILARQPAADVYNNVIIPDLTDAIAVLDAKINNGRASKYAAQGLLGKVYMQMGNYSKAQTELAAVVNGASAAGIELETNIDGIFGYENEGNSEIIFAHQITVSIVDQYTPASRFWNWFVGDDPKADHPVDPDLVAAFDAVAKDTLDGGDLRRAVTLAADGLTAVKFPKLDGGLGTEHDWIELRLADIILLYAEALNETGSAATIVLPLLDDIRTRAGLNILDPATITTQADVRQAIADERRLELAFEGQRWFDLVRTGTAQDELGETFNSQYYLFPIPISEVLATNGIITQNDGY
jgi:starch-binding outer membrane protein, SusD/RagB family